MLTVQPYTHCDFDMSHKIPSAGYKIPSAGYKIPLELVKNILDTGGQTFSKKKWYFTIDIYGKHKYRLNKLSYHPSLNILRQMLSFKKKNPPRFYRISLGYYILDSIEYDCVEYTLSRETESIQFSVGNPHDQRFSLSRRYIVIDYSENIKNYIYLDSHYEINDRGEVIYAHRNGTLIHNAVFLDFDPIESHKDIKQIPIWEKETHGILTVYSPIFSWNWNFSENILPNSVFDDFYEDPDNYDLDYASLSFRWSTNNDFGCFGKFARYDQLQMDTIQIL
jgi:hypothetical protein